MRGPAPFLRTRTSLLILALAAPPVLAAEIPPEVFRSWAFYNDTGWKALNGRDYAKAEARFRLAIDEIRPYSSRDQRLLARSYADLARALYHEGRFADAEPLAKWSLSVREREAKVSAEAVFQGVYLLAKIERAAKRPAEAEPLFRKVLLIQEKALDPDHVSLAQTLDDLAGLLCEQGRPAEAEPLYQRALAIREKALPTLHLDIAETVEHYAAALRRLDRVDEAKGLEDRALTIRAKLAEAARTKARLTKKGFQGFK